MHLLDWRIIITTTIEGMMINRCKGRVDFDGCFFFIFNAVVVVVVVASRGGGLGGFFFWIHCLGIIILRRIDWFELCLLSLILSWMLLSNEDWVAERLAETGEVEEKEDRGRNSHQRTS